MAQRSMRLDAAKKLLGRVMGVKCYFVRVKSIPQTSTFTALATTLQYEDEYAGEIPLLQLFSVTPEILHGSSGNSDVNNAVDRLVKVLSLPRHDDLARYLEGPSEKKQMVGIFRFLLQCLCNELVLNKQEYSAQFLAGENAAYISRGWLGMGTRQTWRGSPDCRCNVDMVSTDKLMRDDDSDDGTDTSCSASGAKVTVEGKKATLGPHEMNQVVGHAVTYGFVHNKRHRSQNPFIPALGISGARCTMMAAFYCPVTDVLMHFLPDEVRWFDLKNCTFVQEGVFLLWLIIHHSFFLKRLSRHEIQSNLQQKFDPETLAHFRELSAFNKAGWGVSLFPRKLVQCGMFTSSSSSSSSP